MQIEMEGVRSIRTWNRELTFASNKEGARVTLTPFSPNQKARVQLLSCNSKGAEERLLENKDAWTVDIRGITTLRVTPVMNRGQPSLNPPSAAKAPAE
jgi:hypothetical protein